MEAVLQQALQRTWPGEPIPCPVRPDAVSPHALFMLDLSTIAWCHARVPIYYWPVLWYWLGRLADTYQIYAEEGRRFFRWHLERNGRIWVEYCDESDEERRVRGARHREAVREPWLKLAPAADFGPVEGRSRHCTVTTPSLHRGDTVTDPCIRPALSLHPP